MPDAVEVATYDPRTDAQEASTPRVREAFIGRLATEGLEELVPLVDTNLFGISVDVRLSAADQADLSTLIAHRPTDGRVHRPAAGRRRRRRAVSLAWT